jgi:hypothetical protein
VLPSTLLCAINTTNKLYSAACYLLLCCWRRLGKRVTGPAVSFTADVLLPTPFFGPCLATYVLIRLLCKVGLL